jgi:hypothetical protein
METLVKSNVSKFLEQMRIKCEAKAKQMNALELSVWNESHEVGLKSDFGFNDKTIAERKVYLLNNI